MNNQVVYWIYDEGGSLDRGERIGNRNEGLSALRRLHRNHIDVYVIGSISSNGLVQRYLIPTFIEQSALFVSDYIAK